MTIEQRRACTEMLEILKNVKQLSLKIPNSLIENMNSQKDNDWKFEYDDTVTLENQKILYSTKVLFSYIYITYIATKEKAEYLEAIYESNSRNKYNPDNIFKKMNKTDITNEEKLKNNTNITLVEGKESFFIKFKNFIFKILHIRK